jgi:hypothetical protein
MSRHKPSQAKEFGVRRIGPDHWRMSWVVDFYYQNSRLRHPRVFTRDTDDAGAVRFAKKHGLAATELKP